MSASRPRAPRSAPSRRRRAIAPVRSRQVSSSLARALLPPWHPARPLSHIELWTLALLLRSRSVTHAEVARAALGADDMAAQKEAHHAAVTLSRRRLCRCENGSTTFRLAGRTVAAIEAAHLLPPEPARRARPEVLYCVRAQIASAAAGGAR